MITIGCVVKVPSTLGTVLKNALAVCRLTSASPGAPYSRHSVFVPSMAQQDRMGHREVDPPFGVLGYPDSNIIMKAASLLRHGPAERSASVAIDIYRALHKNEGLRDY